MGDTITGPYKEDGMGSVWLPDSTDEEERERKRKNFLEKVKKHIEEEVMEEPVVGGYQKGTFHTEEIYIDEARGKPHLEVTGSIDDVFLSISIPLRDQDSLRDITKRLNEICTVKEEESGLFLRPEDFYEVRKKTADGQGRINLGIERAGKDVKVVVLDGD